MSVFASETLGKLYHSLQLYDGKSIPAAAIPSLLKTILLARALAVETEEELRISERLVARYQPRRAPVDIDQEGNVVRLPFQPRIVRTVNPDGGNAA